MERLATTQINLAPSIDENITTVAAHLNQKLHEQAKAFIAEFKTPDKYSNNLWTFQSSSRIILIQSC